MHSSTAADLKLTRSKQKEVRGITLRVPGNVLQKIKYHLLRNEANGSGETTVQGFVYAAVLAHLKRDQDAA